MLTSWHCTQILARWWTTSWKIYHILGITKPHRWRYGTAGLKYLCDSCNKLDFTKCRGQLYNTANMSGRYSGMQLKLLDANQFAIYASCAAHSLNLVGRSAIMDCCQIAVDFYFTVKLLCTLFLVSASRWRILKDCIRNEKSLKSPSDTRWNADVVVTAAITKEANARLPPRPWFSYNCYLYVSFFVNAIQT